MSNPDQIIERFLGSDPIAGTQALHELLALGDVGEEALFSRTMKFGTIQLRRRWLRYVASRESTVVARLIALLRNQDPSSGDVYLASQLFAGINKNYEEAIHALRMLFDTEFGQDGQFIPEDWGPARFYFKAWGHAGGNTSDLWQYVRDNEFVWEKFSVWAFYGACAAFARTGAGSSTIINLITHEWKRPLMKIDDSPDLAIDESIAISDDYLRLEAYRGSFAIWRRGAVADQIFQRWSWHHHWRVRAFGAQILASLRFQRTVTPVIEWLRQEPVKRVRGSLIGALEYSETASGADALIEYYTSSNGEGRGCLARAAWRATNKDRALRALNAVADVEDKENMNDAEAVVSLSRLGHRHPQLNNMLDSTYYYRRLNAALALAYLGDKTVLDQVLSMRNEAATLLERIYLAAALAMLGKPGGAMELNADLVAAAGSQNSEERVDLFFVHRYLQDAVLNGLAAGGEQSSNYLNAWRAELEPLDPISRPVEFAVSKSVAAPPKREPVVATASTVEQAERCEVVKVPLKIFVSYSHKDEKMRAKLDEHLAPLVNEGLIRIWHDREIEAGADWEGEIDKEIGEADIILLLVSAAFLESRYCRKELLRSIEQRSVGKSLPIPIILRPCDWTGVFNHEHYKTQALPRDDRSVADGRWANQDAAFAAIARELRTKIERIRG